MAIKKPLCNYNGETKELQSGDSLPDIVGAVGTAIVDFGVNGSDTAIVAITGQTTIASNSFVSSVIAIADSLDHSADEHFVEEIEVRAGNIVAGTGFTIYARTRNRKLFGQFNLAWSWR